MALDDDPSAAETSDERAAAASGGGGEAMAEEGTVSAEATGEGAVEAGAPSIPASIEVTSAAMNLDRGTKPRMRAW